MLSLRPASSTSVVELVLVASVVGVVTLRSSAGSVKPASRAEAIGLLVAFVNEEPETAVEMPDALLRLAELRWEEARLNYLRAFAAWQEVPEENRGTEPSADYTGVIALYDRILTNHRDFERYDFVLYMKAYALTEIGLAEEALSHYRWILRDFPESRFVPDAHMALGETSFANEEWEAALAEFEMVLPYTDSELYDMALFKSAWCLWRLGRNTEAATRFRMSGEFVPGAGAAGWQISNPPILAAAPLGASLALFRAAGMDALRAKSLHLTGWLEFLLRRRCAGRIEILTPPERGAQLSLRVQPAERARAAFAALAPRGIVADWREPDVIRMAPVPLYNTYADAWRAAAALAAACG